jgi:hypothetical protein
MAIGIACSDVDLARRHHPFPPAIVGDKSWLDPVKMLPQRMF